MKAQKIKFKNSNKDYSILIGSNILNILSLKIKSLCPQTKKVALIFDKGVPSKYKKIILKNLKKYKVYVYNFNANEKAKSIKSVTHSLLLVNIDSQVSDFKIERQIKMKKSEEEYPQLLANAEEACGGSGCFYYLNSGADQL